jgi:hypothetical protein
MPLPSLRGVPTTAALVLFLLLPAAHAAEVSSASEVDTSPGLSPDAVKRVFNQQRQTLVSCMRVLVEVTPRGSTPWNPPAEVDDRILLTFEVKRDGKVRNELREEERPRVEGLYLDRACARDVVRSWTFPTLPTREGETVRVTIRARFSTTADERKAELARLREEFDTLCRTLSALDTGKPPEVKETTQALQRYLSERRASIHPRMVYFVGALAHINAQGLSTLYESGGTELLGAPPTCPKVHAWEPRER